MVGRARAALHLGMAIDGHIGDVSEKLGRPVAPLAQLQEARRVVDELRCVAISDEVGMGQHRFQKAEIGGDATYAIFAQRTGHTSNNLGGRRGPGSDLLKQRIIVARHHCARIGCAAIHPHAIAKCAPIGGNPPVIGDEVIGRIFRCDAAL